MAGPLFRTVTVPADQPVLYQLSIRAPGNGASEVATYTFPLSPSALRSSNNALNAYYNTRGPSNQPGSPGVVRNIDRYGITPPIFTIEGTTGWDRHNTDGYAYTGLQSIQTLQQFLIYYEQLNQQQIEANNPSLYTLEFYDYFTNQFWCIDPSGEQIVRQSADRPLLTYYRFVWVATVPVGTVQNSGPDEVSQIVNANPGQVTITTANALSAVTTTYGPTWTAP